MLPFFIVGQSTVVLRPVMGAKEVLLNAPYITRQGDTIAFTALKMYITNLNLTSTEGNTIHTEQYKLIDLEERESLTLYSGPSDVAGIQFLIGTDSLANVAGILEGPLDPINGMYWTWNSGYINFKLEGTSTSIQTPRKEFEFHIGGYMAPHSTSRVLTLHADPTENQIYVALDLEKWIRGINLPEEYNVMIPGKTASRLADNLQQCFAISYE